jgi:hypothetical protein
LTHSGARETETPSRDDVVESMDESLEKMSGPEDSKKNSTNCVRNWTS